MAPNDCIISHKSNTRGYAYTWFRGKSITAHRLSYILAYGEIPKGMVIDHTCHTEAVDRGECQVSNECKHRACVNPTHLELVTQSENVRRGWNAKLVQTECKNGHSWASPDSYYLRKKGIAGVRECRECARLNNKRYREMRKQNG